MAGLEVDKLYSLDRRCVLLKIRLPRSKLEEVRGIGWMDPPRGFSVCVIHGRSSFFFLSFLFQYCSETYVCTSYG